MALSVASHSRLELELRSSTASSSMGDRLEEGGGGDASHCLSYDQQQPQGATPQQQGLKDDKGEDDKEEFLLKSEPTTDENNHQPPGASSTITTDVHNNNVLYGHPPEHKESSDLLLDDDEEEEEEDMDVAKEDISPKIPQRLNTMSSNFKWKNSKQQHVPKRASAPATSEPAHRHYLVTAKKDDRFAAARNRHNTTTAAAASNAAAAANSSLDHNSCGDSFDTMPKQPVRGVSMDAGSLAKAILNRSSMDENTAATDHDNDNNSLSNHNNNNNHQNQSQQSHESSSAPYNGMWEDSWTTFTTMDHGKTIGLNGEVLDDEADMVSDDASDDDDEDDFISKEDVDITFSSFAERGGGDFGLDDASLDAKKIFEGMSVPKNKKQKKPHHHRNIHIKQKTRRIPPVVVAADDDNDNNDESGGEDVTALSYNGGGAASDDDTADYNSFAERGGGDFGLDDASFDAMKIFEGMKASPPPKQKKKEHKDARRRKSAPVVASAAEGEDTDGGSYDDELDHTAGFDEDHTELDDDDDDDHTEFDDYTGHDDGTASFAERGGGDFGMDDESLDAKKIFEGMKMPAKKKTKPRRKQQQGATIPPIIVATPSTSEKQEEHYSSYEEDMEEMSEDDFAERGDGDFEADNASLDAENIFAGMKTAPSPVQKRRATRKISADKRSKKKAMMDDDDSDDFAERGDDDALWTGDFGEDDINGDVADIFGDMQMPQRKSRSRRKKSSRKPARIKVPPTIVAVRPATSSPFQPMSKASQGRITRPSASAWSQAPKPPSLMRDTSDASNDLDVSEMDVSEIRKSNRKQRIHALRSKSGLGQRPGDSNRNSNQSPTRPQRQTRRNVDNQDPEKEDAEGTEPQSVFEHSESQPSSARSGDEGDNNQNERDRTATCQVDESPKYPNRSASASSTTMLGLESTKMALCQDEPLGAPPFRQNSLSLTSSNFLPSTTEEDVDHNDHVPTLPSRQKSLQKRLELERAFSWMKSTSSFTTDDLPTTSSSSQPTYNSNLHSDESPTQPQRHDTLNFESSQFSSLEFESFRATMTIAPGQESNGTGSAVHPLKHPPYPNQHRKTNSDEMLNCSIRKKHEERILSPTAKALEQSQSMDESLGLLLLFGTENASMKAGQVPGRSSLASDTTAKASGHNTEPHRIPPCRHFTRGKSLQSAAASLHHHHHSDADKAEDSSALPDSKLE